MENFVFALNATMPVFLVILLGWLLQRWGMLDEPFCKTADKYVFRCALPVSLFRSIVGMDFYTDFNLGFLLFCAAATTVMFFGIWAAAWLLKDKSQVGAFAQAAARSSAGILGPAFAVSIYGSTGMVPMMILAAVPLFNVYSVLILSFSPQLDDAGNCVFSSGDRGAVARACKNVVTNPIILGTLAGVPFALLRIQVPEMLDGALKYIGSTATPIALLAVGASFSGGEALTRWRSAAAASAIKLFLLPAVFLPVAVWMGFRQSELLAILIMVGAPTTVSCYIMAKNMRADSVLTANAVLIATLFSSVSITLWLYLLRSFSLI